MTPNLTTEVTAFPSFPIDEEVTFNVEVTRFEDDSTQAFKTSTTKSRKFKLRYENQSDSEMASFRDFFDARFGAFDPFYWNNGRSGEVDIKVRFEDKAITYSTDGPRTYSWSATLIKVL